MRLGGSHILQLLSRGRGGSRGAFLALDFRSAADRMARTRAAAERRRSRPSWSAVLARAAGRAARQPAREQHNLEALAGGRHRGRRDRPAGRALPRARSTPSTRPPRRSPWRGRSRPSRASAACRSSGCRPRTTTSPRSPRRRSRAPTARRSRWRSPDEPTDEARVSVAHRRLGAGGRRPPRHARRALRAGPRRHGDAGAPARALRGRARDRGRRLRRPARRALRRRGPADPRPARRARRRAGRADLPRGARRRRGDRAAARRAARRARRRRVRRADPGALRAARCSSFTAAPRPGRASGWRAASDGLPASAPARLGAPGATGSFRARPSPTRSRTIRSASRRRRCCARSCRTRCCRRRPTWAVRPR